MRCAILILTICAACGSPHAASDGGGGANDGASANGDAAAANCGALTAVFRDFRADHPDFEHAT
ncbi:MAG TPA: hypothetical protein VIV58_39360, partial [Kofleriaceae bacterium]